MIQYLKHSAIDKDRWDACIAKSCNCRIYAFSWYLDLVCPGWEALLADDYTRVFPLTGNRKMGISYMYQPFFTQQLGLFSPEPVTGMHVTEFIGAIPAKFSFVEIHLNTQNVHLPEDGVASTRINHELDLSSSYEALAAAYAQNTRRNIRKATDQEVKPGSVAGTEDLIFLFRENFGKQEGKLRHTHYETIRKIINRCIERKTGYIRGAYSNAGVLSAASFFLFDEHRVYFLFAASSPEARENGAMFLLIDRFIHEHAQRPLILDFEGGNDPNLGRFYKSFGAKEVTYSALRINRLPKIAERALYFARKIRQL